MVVEVGYSTARMDAALLILGERCRSPTGPFVVFCGLHLAIINCPIVVSLL